MRPTVLATVALVASVLGAAAALAVARGAGWVGDEARTVYVATAAEPAATGPQSVTPPALGNGFDPAGIYARRSPGVVTIYAFFGAGGRSSQGSGFVVSHDGHVLTNSHVITNVGDSGPVRGAARVYVEFQDGDRVAATVVGWDLFNDTGVVRVDPKEHALTVVPMGNSSRVVVGEPVAAIGSPFGNQNSLAVGVVSATGRSIDSLTSGYDVADAIQIDAPINHGNSGGPLFDARGRVIGINAQIRSDSGLAEGVGFAIPINSARRSLEQLVSTGRVAYAYIGIRSQNVTPGLARHFKLGAERGALIIRVEPGTPAAKAGLRGSTRDAAYQGSEVGLGGDLVVRLAGEPVTGAEDISRIVTHRLLPGQRVLMTVIRGGTGKRQTVPLVLGERPSGSSG
jgi:2-alkenal reductase